MNKIFLDVGNTRIKWASIISEEYVYHGATNVIDFVNASYLDECLSESNMDVIYIACVASHNTLELIKDFIQTVYGVIPTVLTAQKTCCGLMTGYSDFHKLGVDRWMAMQGAHHLAKGPFIVVDAGTAMTIDAVVDGKHLGGFIVPGLTGLRSSLANDTAELALVDGQSCLALSEGKLNSVLGTDTETAILAGTLYMTAAFLNSIINDLNQEVGTVFEVYMTGGNSAQLAPLIDTRIKVVQDLVLLGMKNIEESVKK